jgi:uncharacterized membrane protein YbhN (UPF0104 family)
MRGVLQVLVAVGLLAWLVRHVGLDTLRAGLRTVRLGALVAPLALVLLDSAVRAEAWRRLLRLHGVRVPWATVLYSHLVGGFVGAFLPSSLGTDVGRMLVLSRRGGVGGVSTVSSMLGLNLLNLLAVCALSSLAAWRLPGAVGWLGDLRLLVLAFSAAYAGGLALALSPASPLPRLRAVLPQGGLPGRLGAKLAEIAEEIHALREAPRALAALLGIAVSNQLLSVAVVFTLGRAVGAELPALTCLLVVPLLTLVRLVPMSVAGLGGDQAAFVLLFAAVGVASSQSLLISLLLAAVNGAYLMLCGILAVATSASELRGESRW